MAGQHGTITTSRVATARGAAAIDRFVELEAKLLEFYGVQAASRLVGLREPPIRVHLLEAGEGEPVVFFHGGDGEAVNWAPLMAPLQKHAHIFVVDRPGCGLSDAFDYRKVDLRKHAADFAVRTRDDLFWITVYTARP